MNFNLLIQTSTYQELTSKSVFHSYLYSFILDHVKTIRIFLIGIHPMQEYRATTRLAVTRKRRKKLKANRKTVWKEPKDKRCLLSHLDPKSKDGIL